MNSLRKLQDLYQVWEIVNHINGWLRILENSHDYSPEEIVELESIDTEVIAVEKSSDKEYREKIPERRNEMEAFKKELEDSYGKENIKAKHLFCLEKRMFLLNERLQEILNDFQVSSRRGIPFWLRSTITELKGYKRLKKLRNRTQVEIYLLKYSKEIKGYFTPEKIAAARNVSWNNIVKVSKAGFILCPFHGEKQPSFHIIEDHFGYCHGCQWKGDIIQFLMDRNSLSFTQAVNTLLNS